MPNHTLLLLSSSRRGNEDYLEGSRELIYQHLSGLSEIVFIPYAGVTVSQSDYTQKVADALPELCIIGIQDFADPRKAIENAEAVMVGGGNTFNLLSLLYKHDLMDLLSNKLHKGMAYVGWSAGSNICGQSIRTTNDMPIIQPPSFDALNVLPFQLNPHYIDKHPPGFNGETRDQRLQEFTTLNPNTPVVALKEGSALRFIDDDLALIADEDAYVFLGDTKHAVAPGQKLNHLLR